MIKKISKVKLIQRLENLQAMADKKSLEPVLVSIQGWMESKENGTFNDYIEKQIKNRSSDVTIIIDDLILETDMYLPTELILDEKKDVIKQFIKAASKSDEIKFMKLYIKVFDEMVDDVGNAESFEKVLNSKFYFIENYKVLPIEELVERYKNIRFLKR